MSEMWRQEGLDPCRCLGRWKRARTSYQNWYKYCPRSPWDMHVYARKPGLYNITIGFRGRVSAWKWTGKSSAKEAKLRAQRELARICRMG